MAIDPAEIRIRRQDTIHDALAKLDRAGSGILLLTKDDGSLERTVTDGDVRRLLLSGFSMQDALAQLPVIKSCVLNVDFSDSAALALMNAHEINHLPVVDASGHVVRVVHRRDVEDRILLSAPHMGTLEREFVDEAFRTNWVAPVGPHVDAFERELAEYVSVPHAAALSSGTAAIHLALRILGVGAGDWVLCSSLTFAASAYPIVYQGAIPVFIDSEPASWNMSPVALQKAFEFARRQGRKPKAVIVVDLYGQSADMDPILEICRHFGVPVVEDAAESLGAQYKGRASGTLGGIGTYSFNGNKIITTSGGGMLVSNNADFVCQARFLSTQARDPAPHYEHSQIGYNYRMSNILAGIGRGQLRVLSDRVAARRRVFERYRQELTACTQLQWMPEPTWSVSTHWLTACTVDAKASQVSNADLIKKLAEQNIEARPVWKPMHLQPVFAGCASLNHSDTSVCERLFASGICLPSGSGMTAEQQDRIIDAIRRALK